MFPPQEEKCLRNNKRFTTVDARKDGVRFTNASLRQLNEEFQGYKETYNNVQSKLAQEVVRVAGEIPPWLYTAPEICIWRHSR